MVVPDPVVITVVLSPGSVVTIVVTVVLAVESVILVIVLTLLLLVTYTS